MFCTLNENGVANRAHCYFKDIDDVIADEFDILLPGVAAKKIPGVSALGLGIAVGLLLALILWRLPRRGT